MVRELRAFSLSGTFNAQFPPVDSPYLFASNPSYLRIFVIDTLNFCFWGQHGVPRWSVCFNEKTYEGYWALCASINRALQEGIPITDPSFYANVSHKKLEYVFRSCNNTQIPLLESRVKVLNEAGTVLIKSFNSSVEEFVASAKGSADKLITLLVHNFSSFRDSVPSTRYNEPVASASQLCFYKRAQIFTADIWACFAATDKHSFHDIGKLTMFADYRVPQALVWLGAIDYSPELLETLTSGEELPHGDPREIQIRGCSIQAVEIIRREIERIAKPKRDESAIINSIVIDFALWDYATEHDEQLAKIPIHRTKSVYY